MSANINILLNFDLILMFSTENKKSGKSRLLIYTKNNAIELNLFQ